jgi:hypothetical protein
VQLADMAGAAQTSQQAEAEAGWEDDFGFDDFGEEGGGGGSGSAAGRGAGPQDGAEGAPPRSLASPVHRAGRVQGSGDSWNDW